MIKQEALCRFMQQKIKTPGQNSLYFIMLRVPITSHLYV